MVYPKHPRSKKRRAKKSNGTLAILAVVLVLIVIVMVCLVAANTRPASTKPAVLSSTGNQYMRMEKGKLSGKKSKKDKLKTQDTMSDVDEEEESDVTPEDAITAMKNDNKDSALYPERDYSNTIAYAISLIKCGDHQSTAAGLIDAALVLRHSVHMTSRRNPDSGSKYDYEMIAIVHRQAVDCSSILKKVGFTILVVDAPVKQSDIKGEVLRAKIHREWCCGHDEFVKWMPYKMTKYPAVVHVDIDFAFLKPMDELFDAIIYDADSPEGKAARAQIPVEFPNEVSLPPKIDAFYTRDWPQVVPGRTPGYQAGFLVVRPDPSVHEELKQIVIEGNYTGGFGRNNGWGGLGYGGFVGAMAMQGLMAYYYDHVRPGTGVELNQCRYNWMGMDVRYRAHPNFRANHPKVGKCRNDKEYCEDCMAADVKDIKNIHFTQCRKPWNCVGVGVKGGAKGKAIDTNAGSYEKCMEVVRLWHDYRTDFENKLYSLTKDERIRTAQSGVYKTEIFMGHCRGEGGANYTQIDASDESFALVPKLYGLA